MREKSIFVVGLGLLFFLLTLDGCASIHHGNQATVVASDPYNPFGAKKPTTEMSVSANVIRSYSNRYLIFVDLTIANNTGKWKRVKITKIGARNPEFDSKIQIPMGEKLAAYAEAAKQLKKIDSYNDQVARAFIFGIAAATAGAAVAADNKAVQAVGGTVAAGVVVESTASAITKHLDELRAARFWPKNHLFADAFWIPPGLFAKRWILLYFDVVETPVEELHFSFETDDGRVFEAHLRRLHLRKLRSRAKVE